MVLISDQLSEFCVYLIGILMNPRYLPSVSILLSGPILIKMKLASATKLLYSTNTEQCFAVLTIIQNESYKIPVGAVHKTQFYPICRSTPDLKYSFMTDKVRYYSLLNNNR